MQKKNLIIVIIVVLLAIIITIIAFKAQKKPLPIPREDQAILDAVRNDSIESINQNLDEINLEDTTDEDLKAIDEDLKNL